MQVLHANTELCFQLAQLYSCSSVSVDSAREEKFSATPLQPVTYEQASEMTWLGPYRRIACPPLPHPDTHTQTPGGHPNASRSPLPSAPCKMSMSGYSTIHKEYIHNSRSHISLVILRATGADGQPANPGFGPQSPSHSSHLCKAALNIHPIPTTPRAVQMAASCICMRHR